MTGEPLPLDDPLQPTWHGERELPDIMLWKRETPNVDVFQTLIDDLGCSDCVYDSFFGLILHLLDIIENATAVSVRNTLLDRFGFRFIQAIEQQRRSEAPLGQLQAAIPRVKKLTIDALETDSAALHFHLATLAACYGDADMGIYISRYGD